MLYKFRTAISLKEAIYSKHLSNPSKTMLLKKEQIETKIKKQSFVQMHLKIIVKCPIFEMNEGMKSLNLTNKVAYSAATQKDHYNNQGSTQNIKSQPIIKLAELNKLFRLEWRKYNVTTRIKLLNLLEKAPEQQIPLKDRYQKQFFKQVIDSLNSQLPKVSQQSINQLLEIFLERKINYSRQISVMNTICRIIIHSKNRKFESIITLQTFTYLIRLKFPRTIILKFINTIAALDPAFQKLQTIFKKKELLKFGILAAEQNYIPLQLTKGIVRCVHQQSYQNFQQLALLYHFCQILPLSIQQKIISQSAQRHLKEVLFNPYVVQQDQNQQQKCNQHQNDRDSQSENEKIKKQQKQIKRQQKIEQDTKQLGASIQKQFFSKISKQKLKNQILSKISSLEQEPSTRELCLLSGISQLRGVIKNHISKQMKDIQPIELMTLIRALPQDEYQANLMNYMKQMEELMSMEQKIFILLRRSEDIKIRVKLQQIQKLIEGNKKISYKQFVGLTRVLALVQNDQSGVSRLIQKIDSLFDNQSN